MVVIGMGVGSSLFQHGGWLSEGIKQARAFSTGCSQKSGSGHTPSTTMPLGEIARWSELTILLVAQPCIVWA